MKRKQLSNDFLPVIEKQILNKSSFTIYLNHIIGKNVILPDGKVVGRLIDLLVDLKLPRPKIIAAVISQKKKQIIIDFTKIEILNDKGKYYLVSRDISEVNVENFKLIRLVEQFMNCQVVDMNKKKTVIVYDLKIAIINNIATVVAVDTGMQGRLRRWGIAELVQKVLKFFDVSIANKLILLGQHRNNRF